MNHPAEQDYHDLLSLKITELKNRAKQLGVEESTYDARSSVSIRKAIWLNLGDLKLEKVDLPVDKEDSKRIYDKLETYLPYYALFQSDRSSLNRSQRLSCLYPVHISGYS